MRDSYSAVGQEHLERIISEAQFQYEAKDLEFEKAGHSALACVPSVLCEIEKVALEARAVQQNIENFYASLAKVRGLTSSQQDLL